MSVFIITSIIMSMQNNKESSHKDKNEMIINMVFMCSQL